jgi:hypothetical protein
VPKEKPQPSTLIDHRKIARELGNRPQQISRWVQASEWPLPHSIIAALYFYRRDRFEHFLRTGRWPTGTKFRGMEEPPKG